MLDALHGLRGLKWYVRRSLGCLQDRCGSKPFKF